MRRRRVCLLALPAVVALSVQACDGAVDEASDGGLPTEDASLATKITPDAGEDSTHSEDGGPSGVVDATADAASEAAAPPCVFVVPDAGGGDGAAPCPKKGNLASCNSDAECASNVCDDKICYGGSGTQADPWQLGGPVTLELLRSRGTKAEFFVLERDIDLTGHSVAPIAAFAGALDGKGHAIRHWAATSSAESDVGFFRTLSGRLERLSLRDFALTATNTGMVGGLVGRVIGSARVHDCHTTGTIDLGASQTAFDVGGLVGGVTPTSFALRPVTVCTTVNVGAVGFLITSSSADVVITGQAYSAGLVGGLVGGNEGGRLTVMDSFARGSVSDVKPHTGTTMPGKGGLTGGVIFGTINVLRSYAAVAVFNAMATGTSGLAPANANGGAVASFWDQTVSGTSVGASGSGLPTATMKQASTFSGAGWSAALWALSDGSYPAIAAHPAAPPRTVACSEGSMVEDTTLCPIRVDHSNVVNGPDCP